MSAQKILQPRVWLSYSSGQKGLPRRLRLSAAHNEWNHVGIALAAMEEGFFATEGLTDVELVTSEDTSDELLDREARQVELIAEGVVDIGIDPRTTFVLEAKDQGNPVCIVAARRKTHAFLLVGKKGLSNIQDLRHMTVDMGQPGGATDVMMRQVLKDSGLEPDRDVLFSYSGGPMHDVAGVAKAFREGRYGPAILSPTSQMEQFVTDGYPVLADLRKLYPSRHDRVTAANEHFCKDYPDLLKGFLKGMMRACRYVLDLRNQASFKRMIMEAGFLITQKEKDSFNHLFTGWQQRVAPDLSLPLDGIELIVNETKKAGKISSSFKTEEVLRLEALHEAQRAVSGSQ